MSKKSGKKRRLKARKTAADSPHPVVAEDRRSVAVTVAWVMSTLATGIALTLYGIAVAVVGPRPDGSQISQPRDLFPAAALFTSLVTSLVIAILFPVVYHFRPQPPPRLISFISLSLAMIPWILLYFRIR